MKTCRNCGITKENFEFRVRPEYKRQGKPIEKTLYTHCKDCEKQIREITYKVRKNAPISPLNCDMCGKYEQKLKLDHDHETHEFRGWLCDNCNRGLGYLGDNIQGLERAILYLNECKLK